ncbi:DUF885 domain-containing protein [Adhaeribacter sp. BT258]|uniref:DUF885 domain-containing protein n=1 Tax=Adhaeribacter terrigena TaxID=2793070 RepID=A0ABS1BZ62_9BACT|nr:DUF885 domain-containing protein [Adhaeribacter terrigena]MBK0402436.1 DUF885 domain-containing protein [Adhaeribacter terrigena]
MRTRVLYLLLFLLVTGGLFSCSSERAKEEKADETPDHKFDEYKKSWVEKLWRMNPEWASAMGYHKYDSVLVIPTVQRRAGVIRTYKTRLAEMAAMDLKALSANNQTDHRMMENFMEYAIWQDSVLRPHEWDPSAYNIGNSVAEILNGRYDKLNVRLRALSHKLDKAPLYYETAIASLKNPTVEHTQLAIVQNKGTAEIFGKAMLDSVEISGLKPEEKDVLRQRIATAKMAVNGYARYLENSLLPQLKNSKNPRSFRIGKAMFAQKFRYEIQASNSSEEIYRKALARKKMLHSQMIKLSRQLWPKYFTEAAPADSLEMVGKMISKLSEKHVPRENFVNAIRNQIPELVKFVNEKKLLTQDPSRPLVVRETPLYMRGGGAGASVSAPGPYDQKADTYYNVTPLDGYSEKEAESYLREYNNYTLQILNIHEAIPGHYTQLVYSNKAPSIIKAILGNGAMIEGWAVYAEIMMLENGYQNSPEMWLMYNKWNLRVTLNAILDYSVHVLGISEKEAMNLLRKEGFQEEIEAREKWTRAKLSQVQLSSYFTGFSEIYDLREELKKKQGKAFDLKEFHEQFLSYGSAPVKYIRELMLAE